jgi:hypothetical protein
MVVVMRTAPRHLFLVVTHERFALSKYVTPPGGCH